MIFLFIKLGDFMFEIITKDSKRYTVEKIQHKEFGIIFEYSGELVMLPHDKIKSIDANYNPVSAKTFIKNK